jgi:hypothetical protein
MVLGFGVCRGRQRAGRQTSERRRRVGKGGVVWLLREVGCCSRGVDEVKPLLLMLVLLSMISKSHRQLMLLLLLLLLLLHLLLLLLLYQT